MRDQITLFVAEGFGLGRLRPAPGTWGSLPGIPLGWLLSHFAAEWWVCLLVAGLMFVVGIPLCAKGAQLRGKKDPGSVVWDEIAAFPVVYAFATLSPDTLWTQLVLGFLLFRLFDIWKPPPVRQCDRLSGGFGIMLDDTVAAIYAGISLKAAIWLLNL